jgi:hypothetical protein
LVSKANADLVVCHLCSNEEVISEERRNASESMRRQANRMRNLSERILTEVEVGKNILIPIPMVDRGKGDPRNLLAVPHWNTNDIPPNQHWPLNTFHVQILNTLNILL